MILLFAASAFVFFLSLFTLARDDYILLRKNVTLENVFNVGFLVLFAALLSARFVYVVLHFKSLFLHPLVFLVIFYYPGLSLTGGILGAVAFLFGYCIVRRFPSGRLFDLFSVSFLWMLAAGFVLAIVIRLVKKVPFVWFHIAPAALFVLITIVFAAFLIPVYRRGRLRDGSLGLLFLISLFLASCVMSFFGTGSLLSRVMNHETIILLPVAGYSAFLLVTREKLHKMLRL